MDSYVDVTLLDECTPEVAKKLSVWKTNKIVTVTGSGATMPSSRSLDIATPITEHFQSHMS